MAWWPCLAMSLLLSCLLWSCMCVSLSMCQWYTNDSHVRLPHDYLHNQDSDRILYTKWFLFLVFLLFFYYDFMWEIKQQPFCGPLSGTTRVSRYQMKHSPTHHPDHPVWEIKLVADYGATHQLSDVNCFYRMVSLCQDPLFTYVVRKNCEDIAINVHDKCTVYSHALCEMHATFLTFCCFRCQTCPIS